MKVTMQRIIDAIRSKRRDEWQALFQQKLSDLREYARAHGERAALGAFGFGMFVVVFYKVALLIACLAVLAYQLILILSDTPKD
jgi:hypothetical protein